MIEKFNFYDLYGYLLPGAAFLAVLWTPFGLVTNSWPDISWTSAVIAAALAYILGHLIQSIATNAVPSHKNRYPSAIYLDSTDRELPEPAKRKIAALAHIQFGLDLRADTVGDKSIDEVRNSAFLFARQILIQGRAVGYAEQFQGMYALMRGLVSVFALGFAYWLGWAGSAFKTAFLSGAAVVIFAIAVLGLINISAVLLWWMISSRIRRGWELGYALILLAAFLVTGYLLGTRSYVTPGKSALLAFLAAWALVGCLRAYGAYESYAGHFAGAVWRDYLAYNVKPGGAADTTARKE